MDNQNCIYLGIKVKDGPVERCKLDNFGLDNKISTLRDEAGKKTNIPSASLELVHHGKILKDDLTLLDSGIKNGEMVHVVKKKDQAATNEPPPIFTDAFLRQIMTALRTFGCTPNAPGWTRAMQVLNDEAGLSEILEVVPSLNDDCVSMSILHEVELLAALAANIHTMNRVAEARPALPLALGWLTRMVNRANTTNNSQNNTNAPTSGFAYSLEALSEDDDDEEEEESTGGGAITQEQLRAALAAAASGVVSNADQNELQRLLLQNVGEPSARTNPDTSQGASSSSTPLITQEMFSSAIANAMSSFNANTAADDNAMDSMDIPVLAAQPTANVTANPPQSTNDGNYLTQVQHMHEMGMTDDTLNVRALLMCGGDVNAAINLILSGALTEE